MASYRKRQAIKTMKAELAEMTAWRDAYAQECVRRDCQQGCGKGCKRWLEQIDGGVVCDRCNQEFALREQYLCQKANHERMWKEVEDRGNRINKLLTENRKLQRDVRVLMDERKGPQAVDPLAWTPEYKAQCQARFNEELDRVRAATTTDKEDEEDEEEPFEDLGLHSLDLVGEKA